MNKLTQIIVGTAIAATPIAAQTAMNAPPVPGPYQVIIRPLAKAPTQTQQRYSPPMPYWMQVQRPQTTGPISENTAQPPAVARAPQQPFIAGWNWSPAPQGNNMNTRNNGTPPTPGFFPGYTTGPATQQPRPAPNYGQNYGSGYRAPNYGPNYAGQPWGQQGFMPMGTPWGNNWNNTGYGYQPRYPMQPPQPQR